MKSSTIAPHEAHLYTTRAESGLIWTGFTSIIMLTFYVFVSAGISNWTLGLPVLAIALVSGAVAVILFYVVRAQKMFLQPGSPEYVGKPMKKDS